eukprot:scaffold11034_cov32-Attheya_sp.AAC.4
MWWSSESSVSSSACSSGGNSVSGKPVPSLYAIRSISPVMVMSFWKSLSMRSAFASMLRSTVALVDCHSMTCCAKSSKNCCRGLGSCSTPCSVRSRFCCINAVSGPGVDESGCDGQYAVIEYVLLCTWFSGFCGSEIFPSRHTKLHLPSPEGSLPLVVRRPTKLFVIPVHAPPG